MILIEILDILKEDNKLNELLGATKDTPKIFPFVCDVTDSIVYNFIPLTNDGVQEQYRLELTIITQNMIKAMEIEGQVKKLLVTTGDEPKTENILSINQNGGGCLENTATNTIHIKLNFTIKNRWRQ